MAQISISTSPLIPVYLLLFEDRYIVRPLFNLSLDLKITTCLKLFNDQRSHHIEASQLICSANQLTGFYMMGTLVVKKINGHVTLWVETPHPD